MQSIATPSPDSVLINGLGQANCTGAPFGQFCVKMQIPEIHVPRNKRIRMRIINPGSHGMTLSRQGLSLMGSTASDERRQSPSQDCRSG